MHSFSGSSQQVIFSCLGLFGLVTLFRNTHVHRHTKNTMHSNSEHTQRQQNSNTTQKQNSHH
ncbi:unnamed protein product, partial [Arabidopsis halleri]